MALEIWEVRHDTSQALVETVEDGRLWCMAAQTGQARRIFLALSPKSGYFARLVELAVAPEILTNPEEAETVCANNEYLRAYMRPGEHHEIAVEDNSVAVYSVRYRRHKPLKPVNSSPDDHDRYM